MGNDGGSIPTRRELVKTAANQPNTTQLKEKQREHLAHRWSQCPLSHRALVPPVVSDYAGDLYNKDAILQYLLPEGVSSLTKTEREQYEEWLSGRVGSLKDVVEVTFQVEDGEEGRGDRWMCPITGKELGVATRAVYLVPCGHAFAWEAVREMKGNDGVGECSVCGEGYLVERDVLPILPSGEEEKRRVVKRIEGLKAEGLSHGLKGVKGKKRKKDKGEKNGEAKESNGVTHGEKVKSAKDTNGSNGIKSSATASLTKKVLEEEDARKKRKLDNDNISSLYAKKTAGKERDATFMTRGFSVK